MEEQPVEERAENSKWIQMKKNLAVNKPLIPLKLTMLFYYGTSTLVMPYMTLLMVQIGLYMEEIAIIYAILPFVTCIMPPLTGLLADKFNCYKFVLITLIASSAVFHTSLLFIDAKIPSNGNATLKTGQLFCDQNNTALFEFDDLNNNTTVDCKVDMKMSQLEIQTDQCYADCEFCFDRNCSSLNNTIFQLDLLLKDDDNCSTEVKLSSLCNCAYQCPANLTISPVINKTKEEEQLKHHKRGFWIYFALRAAASSVGTASLSILDSTAICMVKKYEGDLGKQRLFGVIGQSLFGMLAGVLLDWTIRLKGYPDYSAPFYLGDILAAAVILLVTQLDVDVDRSKTGSLKDSLRVLIRLIDVDFFLFMMLLLGSCWGFLESFLFVFLNEMKASSYIYGLTVTLGCVIGIPFLYVSDSIIRRIGAVNVIVIAFLFYCIRFISYSLIWNPWFCLPFEALEAVTIHMMAVASSTYCADAAPPGLLATLNGAVGSIHYSFGRGVGSLIGGILISQKGTRLAFRFFGISAGICGIIYFLLHRLFFSRMEKNRLRRKSEHVNQVIALGDFPDLMEHEEKVFRMMARRISFA